MAKIKRGRAVGLPVAGYVMAAIGSAMVVPGLLTASRPVMAQAAGQAAPLAFAIPAQPLVTALARFTETSGIQFFFDAAIARDVQSPGVSGELAPESALLRLLAGTGLTYRFTNANTVTLVALPKDGAAAVLPPVTVEGQAAKAETPWGPVSGFVASHAVSGTKTDTPLIETPQSVSVVTRDEMDARSAHSLADSLGYTAGVRAGTMGDSNGYGGDSTSIRGFGGDGTTGPSSNEYLDGMRLGGSGYVVSGLDPYMFERVEVLKGPASVLYGQSTPGGIVNMVSKRPTDTPQGEIELQTGSYGRMQAAFDLSDRLDEEGKLLYRLSAIGLDTDTQTDFSDRKRVAVAPAFTIRPNTDTSLTILARYQQDDFGGSPLNWLPAYGTVLTNPNGSIPRDFFAGDPNYNKWNRKNLGLGYVFEHHFNDTWTVRQNFRYMHNSLDFANVYISSLASMTTANRQAFGMVEHSNDWTLDNQVEANFETGQFRHVALFGLDGQIFQSDTERVLQSSAPTINLYNPVYYQTFNPTPYQHKETKADQQGAYLQDQIKIDNWIAVLGLRQDWAESQTDDLKNGTTAKQKDDALTKRAALMYAFESGLSPYVSYSESFAPTVGSYLASGEAAKPSEGKQYEVGLKYQPPGYNSLVTLSAFDLTRTNVATTDPNNSTYVIQTGEIRSRGIELEGKASLAEGLNATAAYTYLDAEVTKSTDTATGIDNVTVAVQGKQPTRVPTHSASVWLDYTLQSGAFRGLGFGAGTRYVGVSQGDNANSFQVPAFLLFDGGVYYDLANLAPSFTGWSASVTGTNLLDKEYVSSCFGTNRCYYGTGRTVFASLKYKW